MKTSQNESKFGVIFYVKNVTKRWKLTGETDQCAGTGVARHGNGRGGRRGRSRCAGTHRTGRAP